MKTVYTYGHHAIKIGNFTYKNFSELPKLYHKKYVNFIYSSELPNDDMICRNAYYMQYCVMKHKTSYGYDKLMLMNDEVSFLYSTGSYKCIRFETMKEAKEYFEYLCKSEAIGAYQINIKNTNTIYNIGYEFELTENYEIYSAGETYRIYDSGKAGEGLMNVNYDWVCPSPIIGETMCKIPGTRWSYNWEGYCQIPIDIVKITNTKSEVIESNEALF